MRGRGRKTGTKTDRRRVIAPESVCVSVLWLSGETELSVSLSSADDCSSGSDLEGLLRRRKSKAGQTEVDSGETEGERIRIPPPSPPPD